MARAKRFHLDKRVGRIAEDAKNRDTEFLTTQQVAVWFGVSEIWLKVGRGRGEGPPFVRLSKGRIRYRRDAVLKWLKAREFTCTSEYRKRGVA